MRCSSNSHACLWAHPAEKLLLNHLGWGCCIVLPWILRIAKQSRPLWAHRHEELAKSCRLARLTHGWKHWLRKRCYWHRRPSSLLAWLPPSSCWCWPIVQETIEASLRNERGKKKEEVHKTLLSGVCTSLAKEAYMMNGNDPCSGGCTSLVRTLMDNENMSMIVACTSLVRRCDNGNLWMKSLLRKVYLLGQDRKSEFIMETLVNDLCSGGFSLRQGMWHMNLNELIMETVTSQQDKHVWSNTFSPIC